MSVHTKTGMRGYCWLILHYCQGCKVWGKESETVHLAPQETIARENERERESEGVSDTSAMLAIQKKKAWVSRL